MSDAPLIGVLPGAPLLLLLLLLLAAGVTVVEEAVVAEVTPVEVDEGETGEDVKAGVLELLLLAAEAAVDGVEAVDGELDELEAEAAGDVDEVCAALDDRPPTTEELLLVAAAALLDEDEAAVDEGIAAVDEDGDDEDGDDEDGDDEGGDDESGDDEDDAAAAVDDETGAATMKI